MRQVNQLLEKEVSSPGTEMENKSAGENSLILHILHAIGRLQENYILSGAKISFLCPVFLGVTIGLSLRFGASLGDDLRLSDECWKIIVGESSPERDQPVQISSDRILSEEIKGGIIRHGITTLIPEVRFC